MSAALHLRTDFRPDPADWEDDDPMTLVEAFTVFAERYSLRGVSTLRTEIHKGRLQASFVGGVYRVTPASLKALFQCHAKPRVRASTSGEAAPTPARAKRSQTDTSSVTARTSAARAAALSAWGMPSAN